MADQLPFREAIDFLQAKVNLPTQRSDDLRHGAHVRGFSVAGVTRDDILSDFRSAIEKARVQGTGFNEFRQDFDSIVKRYGWTYFSHGKTDEERANWRAQIIYNTNMRTSYMAGRWKQLTDPDVMRYRPYLEYIHSGSQHPRKLHLSWNGRILRADDPAWRYMYPPNGFGCFCDVEARSERDLKRMGKSGPDPSPDLKPYEDTDPRTGQTEMRIPGIDRGWEYNVGQEWQHGMVPLQMQKPLPRAEVQGPQLEPPALPAPTTAEADAVMEKGLDTDIYVNAFLSGFGMQRGDSGYYRDRSGGIITMSDRMFEQRDSDGNIIADKANKFDRGRYALLLSDAIRNPDEIWVDWQIARSGLLLMRSYIKRFVLPGGKVMFCRFEWSKAGWIAVTAFDTTDNYAAKFRRGALLYARK